MTRRKALKSTWFNRLVVAPLILTAWVTLYPLYMIFVAVILGLVFLLKEYLIELYYVIRQEVADYFSTIKDGVRFILGRIKNQ